MMMYSSGEAANKIGVTRDSLFAALKAGAPDAAMRIGSRRIFTEAEVEKLTAWFRRRWDIRDGLLRRCEIENENCQ